VGATTGPEIRAAADTELPADYDPFDFGLLPGGADEYIVTSGALKGQRGFFTRDAGCAAAAALAANIARPAVMATATVPRLSPPPGPPWWGVW
jgi:hypothetical protein